MGTANTQGECVYEAWQLPEWSAVRLPSGQVGILEFGGAGRHPWARVNVTLLCSTTIDTDTELRLVAGPKQVTTEWLVYRAKEAAATARQRKENDGN